MIDDATTLGATGIQASFRQALSHLGTGVVLVTTLVDGRPWGTTVSACCSVSASPPTILVSLTEHCVSARAIAANGRFGVNVLSERQVEVAERGAAPGAPKFISGHCDTAEGAQGPRIAGALAHLDCAVERSLVVADHVLFVGTVMDVTLNVTPADRPLLYYSRGFRRMGSRMTPTDGVPAVDGVDDFFCTVAQW